MAQQSRIGNANTASDRLGMEWQERIGDDQNGAALICWAGTTVARRGKAGGAGIHRASDGRDWHGRKG